MFLCQSDAQRNSPETKYLVAKSALLITYGRDNVLCLFRHFIKKNIYYREASLPDVVPLQWQQIESDHLIPLREHISISYLFRTHFMSTMLEMTAD